MNALFRSGALALGNNGAYGSAWGTTQREASTKALAECRPYGGATCKIERQLCSKWELERRA